MEALHASSQRIPKERVQPFEVEIALI